VTAHQAVHRVATMCRVLGVSPSGYYAWRKRPMAARTCADVELTAHVDAIHRASRGTYGAPRVHAELAALGIRVGQKRVARLMRASACAASVDGSGPGQPSETRQIRPRQISSPATSPRLVPIACGWRTSRTSRHGRGFSISPSSSMRGAVA